MGAGEWSAVTAAIVGGSAAVVSAIWKSPTIIRTWRNGNGNGDDGGKSVHPGNAKECIEHGNRLSVVETTVSDIKDDLHEIKLDVKQILRMNGGYEAKQ